MAALAGCGVPMEVGQGSTSDDRRVTAFELSESGGIFVSGYRLEISDGTTCNAPIEHGQWIRGLRQYPLTCSDGTKGQAVIEAYSRSGTVRARIRFRLSNGVTGHSF